MKAAGQERRYWLRGRVDPGNDGIRRYVLRRYAYDPQSHERRLQVIAAFDNEREFAAMFDKETADLERHRTAGEGIDPVEHISGVVLGPGARCRAQQKRLIRRAIEHGVSRDPRLQRFELPPCGTVLRALRRLLFG